MPSYTEEKMSACLKEVDKKDWHSLRKIAVAFDIHESTVRLRLKRRLQIDSGDAPKKVGRPTVISATDEVCLAECISVLCKNGFSPTLDEIRLIVSDYVKGNNIETPFTNNLPGRKWMNRFMNANNLSLKKATMISKVRKDGTSNPFRIYEFYELLQTIVEEHQFEPDTIWNMDETAFCLDPKKCKSVAPKGVKAFKLTQGAGRENITVLGVANAAGRVLDPLIINQGQNFQISWRGDRALPNTFYGVSSKGWMTSDVMLGWFDNFIAQEPKRPLLLIFDGHLTHFSINVIKKAIDNEIILMKLPPHVTYIMQPLDVGMFGPLKRNGKRSSMNIWVCLVQKPT